MPKKDELPPMRPGFILMVADHKFELHGGGHHIVFTPGVPMTVAPCLQPEALAHGARAVGGLPTVATAPALDPQKDSTSEEYRAAVRTAAEVLLITNQSTDFGANGKPYAEAWVRELGWKPILEVRSAVWDEVKNAHTLAALG